MDNSYLLINIINHNMTVTLQEIQARLENFKKFCRQHKLPQTPQKLAIFRVLASSCSHPSAQEIYDRVKEEFYNISLATVYKNLKKFTVLGLCLEIPIPGGNTRYDAKLEIHGHAVDTDTDLVYDLELAPEFKLSTQVMGKKVKQAHVTYYI